MKKLYEFKDKYTPQLGQLVQYYQWEAGNIVCLQTQEPIWPHPCGNNP